MSVLLGMFRLYGNDLGAHQWVTNMAMISVLYVNDLCLCSGIPLIYVAHQWLTKTSNLHHV